MKKMTILLLPVISLVCIAFSVLADQQANTRTLKDDNGWTIIDMYTVNPSAGGLAYDGEFFYIGSYGGGFGDRIYQFDPLTEELTLLFQGTGLQSSYGLTFDGTHLWTIQQRGASVPAVAQQRDMQGNELQEFSLPGNFMSGIAWDDGNFWVATYFPNPGTIHYVDDEGTVISEYTPPTNQPWDLALQGDKLWIVDFWNNYIHHVESDGTLIQSFPYDDHRATGIYHDGTFLWYIGRTSHGVSTLYKVDPFGTGTPVIGVSPSYYFGNVTLGETGEWNMNIQNQGTGDLVISGFSFGEGNTAFSVEADLPIIIEAGSNESVQVTFEPDAIAVFEETLLIQSNDVANPAAEVVLTGNGLASGPYLVVGDELIDFATVRMNSSSRLYLELMNMGDEPLTIGGIDLSPLYFYFDWTVDFPITLGSVESAELPFWFMPESPGVIEGEASVSYNNEDQSPYVIELTGVSEDDEYPIGTILWEIDLPGSSFDNPRAIMSIPDVTDDRVDDVIVCTRGNRIMLFNGNSSGTPDLIWETQIGTVEYPKAIALADDINEDSFQDFVIGTAYGDRAVTAVSSRTGEIIWRFETNNWGDGGWVYMVDIKYDYNGNGYRDVLAATGDDGQGFGPRRIFLLNGKTGELIWDTFMGGAAYSVLAVEDFTGDGIPDVIGGGQTAANQGRVIAINGANGSIVWEYITAGTSVWALEQISDITDNGIPDLIAGSFNGFYYLMDITNGNVEHSGSLGGVLIIDFWQAGDLNDDGYMDIIPANSTSPNARAISGLNGQYIWTAPVQDQPWSVAVMKDITGDGINDMAVGTVFQNNFVNFISGSDGEVLHSFPMPDAVDAIAAIPDITRNNAMEVVAGARNNYVVALSGGTAVSEIDGMLSFLVTDDLEPANPVEGAIIEIEGIDDELITNAAGHASIALPPGTYSYSISHNCHPSTDDEFIMPGNNYDLHVVMAVTPGDANGDGLVNSLDVIKMVNYFLDDETDVFCFNNADVNQDGVINILDVIAVVNIFAEGKARPFADLMSDDAHLFLDADGITLYSDGSLAGLQFELTSETGGLPEMMLLSPHHEMMYVRTGNVLRGTIFSLGNAALPAGKTRLVTFSDATPGLDWGNALAGNLNATEVPVQLHSDAVTGIDNEFSGTEGFKAYPNPAGQQLWVEFINFNDSPVHFSLVNILGQPSFTKIANERGKNVLTLDLGNLEPGIYFLRMQSQSGVITEMILVE